MLGNYASCMHVVSSVTVYRSSVVDLSRSRAVHAVEHDPCCPDPVRLQGATCQAVHYGLCSPLIKLPPFVIAPPCIKAQVKNQVPNRNPTAVSPPIKESPTSPASLGVKNSDPLSLISDFDPVQLLADTDLEGQLEALVTSFVAQDKFRLATRRTADGKESPVEAKTERRIIRRPGVEVVDGKLVPVTKNSTPEYRKDGGGVKAQVDRFASPKEVETSKSPVRKVNSVQKVEVKEPPAYVNAYQERAAKHQKLVPKQELPKDQLRNGHIENVTPVAKTKWDGVLVGYKTESGVAWERDGQPEPQRIEAVRAISPEKILITEGPTIPHPKLTTVQRQHMRERSLSPTDRHHAPTRPFLTKGSVAERVLLFERAPERTQAIQLAAGHQASKASASLLSSAWRGAVSGGLHSKIEKEKENIEQELQTGSLRRLPKTATRSTHNIPRFYYPQGKPLDHATVEEALRLVSQAFASLGNRRIATFEQFGVITKACNLPLYCKAPLFQAAGGDKKGCVHCDAFLDYWKRVITSCNDEASKFVRIFSRGTRSYLIPEDFLSMLQDMIETHPGLTFLKDAPEFHSRYVHTVIARIFYCVNRSWTGKITVNELRKSNFLRVVRLLEDEEDINQITEYFSYEHFYVIYCKFWELDKDHDLFIDKADLSRHNDGAISSRMINRIFSGAVTRGPILKIGKMSYSEFVWFLISEEDKRHPRSIEYWFRCMDIDGDGFLSMYELEYFYDEQMHRMEALGIETLPFKDCLCQMLDMINPNVPGCISLSDLKRCRLTPIFFDTFFNLEKYLDHEQRDPFASQRLQDQEDGLNISDWDRYAAEEYELLVSEENANDQQEDLMYEEYDENDCRFERMAQMEMRQQDVDDEDYDYADSDADYHY